MTCKWQLAIIKNNLNVKICNGYNHKIIVKFPALLLSTDIILQEPCIQTSNIAQSPDSLLSNISVLRWQESYKWCHWSSFDNCSCLLRGAWCNVGQCPCCLKLNVRSDNKTENKFIRLTDFRTHSNYFSHELV